MAPNAQKALHVRTCPRSLRCMLSVAVGAFNFPWRRVLPLPDRQQKAWRTRLPKGVITVFGSSIFGRHSRTIESLYGKCNRPNDDSRAIDSLHEDDCFAGGGRACRATHERHFPFEKLLLARHTFADLIPRVPLGRVPHHFSTHSHPEGIGPRKATIRTSRPAQLRCRCRFCESSLSPRPHQE
jgi:hypothetical protein